MTIYFLSAKQKEIRSILLFQYIKSSFSMLFVYKYAFYRATIKEVSKKYLVFESFITGCIRFGKKIVFLLLEICFVKLNGIELHGAIL